MKLYEEKIDPCSGSKSISILSLSNGRSFIGIFPGYFSIFYRIFYTRFEIVNAEVLGEVLNTCDMESLTKRKFENFLNEPLPFWKNLYYRFINKNHINFISDYSKMWKKINGQESK
jgi:hypothetical protein